MVQIALKDLSPRQLKLHLVGLLDKQGHVLKRIEKFMSDLTTSVSDLQAAVDSVAVRWASQMAPLTEALAAAQAANDETNAELTEALASAQAAADSVSAEVAELNALGAEPEVPVEVVPVEELPAPPSEDQPPVGEEPTA
jgi:chromosome segregation ATPase